MEWLDADIYVREGKYKARDLLDMVFANKSKKEVIKKALVKEPDHNIPPGTKVILDTLHWISGNEERKTRAVSSLMAKSRLSSSPKSFIRTCLALNVPVTVDFIFNRMDDDGFLKTSDLAAALDDKPMRLILAMEAWGLMEQSTLDGSKAAKAVLNDMEMKALVRQAMKKSASFQETTDSMLESSNPAPGAKAAKVKGSAAKVMATLKSAQGSVKPDTLKRMVEHIKDNEADPKSALKPIIRLLSKNEQWESLAGVVESLEDRIPVGQWAEAFNGDWEGIYGSLCQNMSTKGKIPPWLAKA
jgi:hypothetical protein